MPFVNIHFLTHLVNWHMKVTVLIVLLNVQTKLKRGVIIFSSELWILKPKDGDLWLLWEHAKCGADHEWLEFCFSNQYGGCQLSDVLDFHAETIPAFDFIYICDFVGEPDSVYRVLLRISNVLVQNRTEAVNNAHVHLVFRCVLICASEHTGFYLVTKDICSRCSNNSDFEIPQLSLSGK